MDHHNLLGWCNYIRKSLYQYNIYHLYQFFSLFHYSCMVKQFMMHLFTPDK